MSRHPALLPLIITGMLLSTGNLCRCQNDLNFEHFTSENGLSENVVYAIFQDSKGYLWFGTHDGLNRYDGYTFKKFRHDPADSNSLPDNTIKSIDEDSKGNLWLATNAGLSTYGPQSGKFKRIELGLQSNSRNVQQVLYVNKGSPGTELEFAL